MSNTFMRFLFLIILIVLGAQAANAALDARYDDYDGYPLISVLVSEGKWDLALDQMKQLSATDRANKNVYSYWMGVIHFKKEKYTEARKFLETSTFPASTDEYLAKELFLGRTHYYLKANAACAAAFKNAEKSSLITSSDVLLRAECLLEENKKQEAWFVLTMALNTYKNIETLSFTIQTLMQMELNHLSTFISLDWLARYSRSPSDFLTISDIFLKQKNLVGRVKVLEMARAKFPMDTDINLSLTQMYFEKGMLIAAEEGFARASQSESKYAYHAAEMNRQLGRYERSQFFNSRIPDEKERLKQKLAIYVDKGQFAMIASLEPVIQRTPLINDDEVRYALAYSLVRSGEYKRPLQYLAKITSQDFIEKTVILRNALTDCVEKSKVCKL
jgi:tetratricopeptide (TPR) repeat protein